MDMNQIVFQIGLELSNILPLRQTISGAGTYLFNLARSLRHSGSDLLVEEDLTAFFGRVWIQPEVSSKFKQIILKSRKIIALPYNNSIELSCGPGPTLDRAFTEQDTTGYLATIIQLSLLGWTHDRPSLASMISFAMNKRLEMGIRDAVPSPGYNSIIGTLAACSTQSTAFQWNLYLDLVRDRLLPLLDESTRFDLIALPASLLLACVDSFSVLQRFPDEYLLKIDGRAGCVTLVAWSHYVLGLSVSVRSKEKQQEVIFESPMSPTVNVFMTIKHGLASMQDVCLMSRKHEIILRVEPTDSDFLPAKARERVPLFGYCAVELCREFNEPRSWLKSELFKEAETCVIAIALALSRRLVRSGCDDFACSIDKWQIWESANVLFANDDLDIQLIEKIADSIPLNTPVQKLPITCIPTALQDYLMREPTKCSLTSVGWSALGFSAIDVLCFASVVKVRSCVELPIIVQSDYDVISRFTHSMLLSTNQIAIKANDLFGHICWRLLGDNPRTEGFPLEYYNSELFAISEFGWTVFLSVFAARDHDPSTVKPESLYIYPGVPTDRLTGERKTRIQDATTTSSVEFSGVSDKRTSTLLFREMAISYLPRCVSPVTERREYYSIRDDAFSSMIRFKGEHLEPLVADGSSYKFEAQKSYRRFHDNLWETYRTPACEHCHTGAQERGHCPLNVDVVTAAGNWSWLEPNNDRERRNKIPIPERIVVILVKGDLQARWLAVGATLEFKGLRRTMLRSLDCCENCAVQEAANRKGKWLVII